MSRSGRRRAGVGRALVLGLVAVATGVTAAVMSDGGRIAAAPVTTTFTYGGGPVAIPDGGDLTGNNPGATVGASVSATGLSGVVTDVNLLVGGSACSAAAGATGVGIDHTFINDLQVRLTSPSGTTVTVINEIDGGGNNLCQTLLDDEGAASIQGVVTSQAPFTGTFTPNAPLSAFDGESPNGTWTLAVQDFFSADIGSIRDFTVIITTDVPAPSAVKTVSGQMIEGGLVEYQIVLTNPSTAEVADATGDELTDFLPAGLSLVSATATSGTAVADVATNAVTWNGALAANGGTASVTVTATVNAGTAGTTIENQALVSFDSDGDGINETSMGSAAAVGAAPAPTTFTVGALALTKTAGGVVDVDGNGTTAGDTVSYSFTVSNNSDEIVTDVAVDDPLLGGAIACGTGPLAPGTSRTCGPVTYVLTESDLGAALVNTATATASADGIALSAAATVQTPIPAACSAVPSTTTEPPTTTGEQPLVIAELPDSTIELPETTAEQPDSTIEEPPESSVEPPDSTTEPPETTAELPDSTIEEPPTSDEVQEPTVDSSVAVTESSDITEPLGFAAAPAQVDPCAPPPSTSTIPTSTTPATAPPPSTAPAGATVPPPAPTTSAAVSGGGGGSPTGSLPATGSDTSIAAAVAAALLAAGIALAGGCRRRDERR